MRDSERFTRKDHAPERSTSLPPAHGWCVVSGCAAAGPVRGRVRACAETRGLAGQSLIASGSRPTRCLLDRDFQLRRNLVRRDYPCRGGETRSGRQRWHQSEAKRWKACKRQAGCLNQGLLPAGLALTVLMQLCASARGDRAGDALFLDGGQEPFNSTDPPSPGFVFLTPRKTPRGLPPWVSLRNAALPCKVVLCRMSLEFDS